MSSRIRLTANPRVILFALLCLPVAVFTRGAALAADAGAGTSTPGAGPQSVPAAQADSKAAGDKASSKVNRLGAAENWTAYAEPGKSGTICYLGGKPDKSEPAAVKRGSIGAYVTHRPAEKSFNVISFAAGHPLKDSSEAKLAIDNHQFTLFTNKDTAWARDAASDKAIVDAMARGKQAVVKSLSKEGTFITDTYALAGFAQVLDEIDKACGVKR